VKDQICRSLGPFRLLRMIKWIGLTHNLKVVGSNPIPATKISPLGLPPFG
jgi:hypothetical protein